MRLNGKLDAYKAAGALRFHMPGHKGKIPLDSAFDATELDFCADVGFLDEAAANFLGTEKGRVLTGGSTLGILASILSVGGDCLIEATAHKSVFNALKLSGRKALTVPTDCSAGYVKAVAAEDVERVIRDSRATNYAALKAIVVTSPNYYGFTADIPAVKKIADKYGLRLIIDAAHGAHFHACGLFPKNYSASADLYVTSLHKTMPALTQSALLGGTAQAAAEADKYLDILKTSSPSYLMLAQTEKCLSGVYSGETLYRPLIERLSRLKNARGLRFIENDDPFRPVLKSGAGKSLEKNGIFPEFFSRKYVIFIVSVLNTVEEIDRLEAALLSTGGDESESGVDCGGAGNLFPPVYGNRL